MGNLGVDMPADLRNILDHVITALPAIMIFVCAFAWHTRSLLAKLESRIKAAQSTADEAKRLTVDFRSLFEVESTQRRDMGVQIWEAVNGIKQTLARIETRMEERR
jgi:hypothetical protein